MTLENLVDFVLAKDGAAVNVQAKVFFMSSRVTYVTDHILSKNLQSRLPFIVGTSDR